MKFLVFSNALALFSVISFNETASTRSTTSWKEPSIFSKLTTSGTGMSVLVAIYLRAAYSFSRRALCHGILKISPLLLVMRSWGKGSRLVKVNCKIGLQCSKNNRCSFSALFPEAGWIMMGTYPFMSGHCFLQAYVYLCGRILRSFCYLG